MINRAVLLFSFSLILIGCSNDTKDLKHYMNQIKLKKGNEIAAAPVCSVLPKFQFPDNDNRRDPFILIKQQNPTKSLEQQSKRILEDIPLNDLIFVGTLKQGSKLWGLIQQPDKQIIRVLVGDTMGKNKGKIVAIQNNFIELQEHSNSSGIWKKQMTKLNLNQGRPE